MSKCYYCDCYADFLSNKYLNNVVEYTCKCYILNNLIDCSYYFKKYNDNIYIGSEFNLCRYYLNLVDDKSLIYLYDSYDNYFKNKKKNIGGFEIKNIDLINSVKNFINNKDTTKQIFDQLIPIFENARDNLIFL